MSGLLVPRESQLKYLHRRTAELLQLQNSLTQNPDWDLAKKTGHQIKGNAATFGFPELAEYGQDLEKAAISNNVERARDLCEKLNQEVRRLLTSTVA